MKSIQLSQNKIAFVSDEDFERVNAFKWTAHKGSSSGSRWYAVRQAIEWPEIAPGVKERRRVWTRLHRFILDLPPGSLGAGDVVDHIDGDGLNCQRWNLETVSREENERRAREKRKKNLEPHL